MKIISWNIRRMNSMSKRAVLKCMILSFQGECVFIQETKMEVLDAQVIRAICPWSDCQVAFCPSIGASGGILIVWTAVFWQKLDEFVGRFSVSVLLKDVRCNAEWVATSVYGPSNVHDKVDLWVELSQVAGRWHHPWLLGGDFNVIMFPNEKKGGCTISPAMKDFSDWIRHHDLFDLPSRGADFTWSNLQINPVMSRLD